MSLQAVRDLHQPMTVATSGGTLPVEVRFVTTCRHCVGTDWERGTYPCSTIRALEDDDPPAVEAPADPWSGHPVRVIYEIKWSYQ